MARSGATSTSSALGTLVFLLWGLIAWGLQFTAVYVGHTWLCAMGAAPALGDLMVAALTALAIAAILPVAVAPSRMAGLAGFRITDLEDARSLFLIARAIALLSLLAAAWTGVTAAFVQACELAR